MRNAIILRAGLGLLCLVALAGYALQRAAEVTLADIIRQEVAAPSPNFPYGEEPDQFAQLWLPEGEGPFPVAVLIHGGCWMHATHGVSLMSLIADDLRRHGIASWNIEYRRYGTQGAGYPGTFDDVARAIGHLRRIATTQRLDLARVITVGHSAGGHLALWAAARHRLPANSILKAESPLPMLGAVSLAGVGDLAAYRDGGAHACGGARTIEWLVDHPRRGQSAYGDTSPAAMVPLMVPQVIVTGEDDTIVPPVYASDYAKLAQHNGDTVQLITIKNAAHFEVIDPGSHAWPPIRAAIISLLKAQPSK